MCLGVAVPIHEIPEALIRKHGLADRIVQRDTGTGREIQFLYRQKRRLLPVYVDNQLRILEWGCSDGKLPKNGYCYREWIESGLWQELRPQPAMILVAMALELGVWYQVKQGIECVVVRGHAYMLTEPATHYYRVMTRANRMPVLVGQTI